MKVGEGKVGVGLQGNKIVCSFETSEKKVTGVLQC